MANQLFGRMKEYSQLALGIYQYIIYSGWIIPSYIMANLQHVNIPQSELNKFREEWIKQHAEWEGSEKKNGQQETA